MFRIGWFSTGRDEVARDLLGATMQAIRKGEIPAKIAFVFCNQDKGEDEETDGFLQFAYHREALSVVTLSSNRFKPGLRQDNLERWRREYDQQVINCLKEKKLLPVDIMVLAGYMLIVSDWLCQRYHIVNLHPAVPQGPAGTWQEVIWQLIEERAEKAGAKTHWVTPALDQGPAIAYCTFPIKGKPFDQYWLEIAGKSIEEIKKSEGENNPLFRLIRQQGIAREIPLLLETLKILAGQGCDLTLLIDKKIESR